MKDIPSINQEINDITFRLTKSTEELKKGEENKLRKRIPFLKHCIMYLESGPNPQFLKAEISKVETKINLRMGQFPLDQYQSDGVDKKTVSRLRREHEKKYEIPKLREQVRTLRYLLKS